MTQMMKQHICTGARDTVIGVVGGVASWDLREWNIVFSMGVAVVTILYLVIQATLAIARYRRGQ